LSQGNLPGLNDRALSEALLVRQRQVTRILVENTTELREQLTQQGRKSKEQLTQFETALTSPALIPVPRSPHRCSMRVAPNPHLPSRWRQYILLRMLPARPSNPAIFATTCFRAFTPNLKVCCCDFWTHSIPTPCSREEQVVVRDS
jgi:hypothetical protein